jgi:UDP-GlcNAc:undecaprenyl-phosphate/decaprenyl-phosphate GlcNAc-1-phosphate transferase
MFLLGLWDDLRPLGAKTKLIGQLTVATGAYFMGLRVELLTGFTGESIALYETIALTTTVGWLVALPNIVNLIDGIDGLAGGLGVFATITLAIVMIGSGQLIAGAIALSSAGATIGFLIFNFPPAKIYMGDGGAYSIGSVIATLSLQSSQKGSIASIFLVVMIALGLPILDTTFAILRRGLRGVPLSKGDAGHIHHRLLDRGHSTRRTVFYLYLLCLTLSLAALAVFWTHGHALPIVAAALFIGSISLGRYLGIGKELSNVRKQVAQASE